jgi:diguanylate cyclase (GGDEF)-like protein
MGTKRERRFAEPHVPAPGRNGMAAQTLRASQQASIEAPLDFAGVIDADTRGTQPFRGIHSQPSARFLASAPKARFRPMRFNDQAGSSALTSTRSAPRAVSPKRVLVAEGDSEVRQTLQTWLQGWGYQVVVATNGAEAWRVLEQEHPPELVILNRIMPEIEGVELSRRLRHEQRDYYHYILLITDDCEKHDIGHALESGADDYLVKPFGSDELKARLTAASRILSLQDNLIQARESLLDQATKDALTGVWNRPAVLELFQHELDRASRVKTSTGLLIVDLDHFKNVNDTYGHLAGDIALKETARRLKRAVRSYDLVGRYGGEEFLIVFPECSQDQLCRIAENIRLTVSSQPVVFGALEIPISLSIGAVAVTSGDWLAGDMIAVADVALYQAKNTGRNRAVCCERPWHEILRSNNTQRATCAKCKCGIAQHCAVPSQGPIGPRQRMEGATMPAAPELVQIPIRPGPSAETPIAFLSS